MLQSNWQNRLQKMQEWGVYALFFLMPFQTHLILRSSLVGGEYDIIALYGFDVVAMFVLSIALVQGAKLQITNYKLQAFVILYFIFSVLNIYFSLDSLLALSWFIRFNIFLILGVLFVGNIDKVKALFAFLSSMSIHAFIGIEQFLSQRVWASTLLGIAKQNPEDAGVSVIEYADERWLRAYGGLPHPNIFGGLLALSLLAGWYVYSKTESRYMKLFVLVATVIQSGALFFSFSRSAWAALGISFAVLFLLVFLKRKEKLFEYIKYSVAIVLPFLILGFMFSNLVMTRVGAQGHLEEESLLERYSQKQQAVEVIREHWLWGSGFGNYTLALENLHPGFPVWAYQPVHNTYMLLVAEWGGVTIFLVVLILLFLFRVSGFEFRAISIPLIVLLLTLASFDHYLLTSASVVALVLIIFALKVKLS